MPPRKLLVQPSPSRKSNRIKMKSLFSNTISQPIQLPEDSPPPSPPQTRSAPQDSDDEIEGEVQWNNHVGDVEAPLTFQNKPKRRSIKTFYGQRLPKKLAKKAMTLKVPIVTEAPSSEESDDDHSADDNNQETQTTAPPLPLGVTDKTRPQGMVRSSDDSTLRFVWSQQRSPRSRSPPSRSHSVQTHQLAEPSQRISKARTKRAQSQTTSQGSIASQTMPPPPPLSTVNATVVYDNAPGEEDGVGLKKIRVNEKIGPDGKILPCGRGVVIGRKLDDQLRLLKTRIRIEKFPDNTPDFGPWKSLFVHEIGRYVRDSLPMNVPGFSKLGNEEKQKLVNHLSTYFVIEDDDEWLKEWVYENAANTFRRWKCLCHKHFIENKEELPYEFRRRQHEWEWLCNHFKTPQFEDFSKRMITTRNSDHHVNHSSGKKSYAERVQEYLAQGNKAPLIATVQHVYKKDRIGSDIANKLKEKIDEMIEQQGDGIEDVGELSMDEQFKLIESAKGKTSKGTKVLGSSCRRPPRPRGGISATYRSYHSLQEELQKTKEEQAREREVNEKFKQEMEAKWKALAEHVRFTPAGPSNYQSEEDSFNAP